MPGPPGERPEDVDSVGTERIDDRPVNPRRPFDGGIIAWFYRSTGALSPGSTVRRGRYRPGPTAGSVTAPARISARFNIGGRHYHDVLSNSIIGDAYTSTTTGEVLERLVDVDTRLPGTDGEHEAAETIADRFRAYGLREVATEAFSVPGWRRGDASVELQLDRSCEYSHQHELLALPRSAPGRVTAAVADLGDGSPAAFENTDVDGKIVIVSDRTPSESDRWIHRNEKYYRAVDAGAAGFMFRSSREGCLPPTGNVGHGKEPGPIPAVGISKELGDRLVRRCQQGTNATLHVDCEHETLVSRNVHGVVGPADGPEILVTAHHDAHDIGEGAVDNAAGCALVVELARILTRMEAELETRIRFVTFGAEEFGTIGSSEWVETQGIDDVAGIVNVDAAGSSRTLQVHNNGFETIEAVVEKVASALDIPIESNGGQLPWGDHWPFVRRGVPGALVSSVHEGDSLRGWEHTHGDTLDKLDSRDLRALVVPVAELVCRLASRVDELAHVPESEIRDAAVAEGVDVGMRVTGEWPWE